MSKTNKQNYSRKRRTQTAKHSHRHCSAASPSNNNNETELYASERKVKLNHYNNPVIAADDFFL